MPTKKIAELPNPSTAAGPAVCRHPDHNPPAMMVYENGLYEHTCAGCGNATRFAIGARPTMSVRQIAATDCPTTLGDVWIGRTKPVFV